MSYQPDEFMKQATDNRDYAGIRNALASIIQFDPAFNTHELKEALKYVEDRGIDIFEKYKKSDPNLPMNNDKSAWDQHYYATSLVYLCNDFTEERLRHVCEVSLATHKDMKASSTQNTIPESTAQYRQGQARTGKQPHPLQGRQIAMIIGAVILLATVIVLILRAR